MSEAQQNITQAIEAAKVAEGMEFSKIRNNTFFEMPDMRVIGQKSRIVDPVTLEKYQLEFSSIPQLFTDVLISFNFHDGKTQHGTHIRGVLSPLGTSVPSGFLYFDFPGGLYMRWKDEMYWGDNSEKEALKHGYIHDGTHFYMSSINSFSHNDTDRKLPFTNSPFHFIRLCRPNEKNWKFYEKLKSLRDFKPLGDHDMGRFLINRIGKDIELPPDLGYSFRQCVLQPHQYALSINNEMLSVVMHAENAVFMFLLDFTLKIVRLSDGTHVSEFSLNRTLEQFVIHTIYNEHTNSFHRTVRNY